MPEQELLDNPSPFKRHYQDHDLYKHTHTHRHTHEMWRQITI